MENIPIRYQQHQPQTSSWGSQQGYQQQQQQPSYQQQPSTSSWGQQQQIPQGHCKPGMFTGLPEQGVQQQQIPSQQDISSQKYGQFGSQVGGQVGQSQVGQIVQKEIRAEHVSTVDLTTLHVLLRLFGHQYVKEKGMCDLADDKQGLLKKFHTEVTVKNLEYLTNLAKKWNYTIPFPVNIEQRGNEVKQAFQGAPKIFTEGELLTDLCISTHHLASIFACGLMSGTNEDLKEFCKSACGVMCQHLHEIKQAIKNTDQDFCPPCVKSVVCREGVCERR